MNTYRELISMLEDSGAKKLHHSQNHVHYKLPNGNRFVTSSTPGDQRSYKNAISTLRRELRKTHPEIAERGRSLPKIKRFGVTLGEMVAIKGIGSIPIASALPGCEIVSPPEVEYEVLPPELEPVLESLEVPIPRKPRSDAHPSAGKALTLTAEQLQTANSILHKDGDAAMNAFISECRSSLVPASKTYPQGQKISPDSTRNSSTYDEDQEMANILERARAELIATTTRITNYEIQLTTIASNRDTDILRQAELETYITKHEALANDAATLIANILPPVVVERKPKSLPETVHTKENPKKKRSKNPRMAFTMDDIRKKTFPIIRSKKMAEFTMDNIMEAIEESNFKGPKPTRAHMQTWIAADISLPTSLLERCGKGLYRFKDSNRE